MTICLSTQISCHEYCVGASITTTRGKGMSRFIKCNIFAVQNTIYGDHGHETDVYGGCAIAETSKYLYSSLFIKLENGLVVEIGRNIHALIRALEIKARIKKS